jgi:hypothetical protein
MRRGWRALLERIAGSPKVETARDLFHHIGLAGSGIGCRPIVYFVLANLSNCFFVSGLQNSHCNFPAFLVTGNQLLLALS